MRLNLRHAQDEQVNEEEVNCEIGAKCAGYFVEGCDSDEGVSDYDFPCLC